jgi:thioredoxin reductase
MDERYDVVVIGGGAAGLSGALTLARARRSVLVVDAGEPRNAPAGNVHTYLGREGTPPAELYAIGRGEVTGYGGSVVDGRVVAVSGTAEEGFRVELAGGQAVAARRLLVATGLVDVLPEVPGLAEGWGSGVLHCPYCHGWEVRDGAIGVLGGGPLAVLKALLWRQWSDDVVLFRHTGPAPSAEEAAQLAARGIRVVEGEVAGLEFADGAVSGVRLASGEVIAREAVAVSTQMVARADLLTGLGLAVAEQGMPGAVVGTSVTADPTGATGVPGVWVAGNVTDLQAQVIVAAAEGLKAAAAINMDLIQDDARRAVGTTAVPA